MRGISSGRGSNEWGGLRIDIDDNTVDDIAGSVEVFQSFMAAAMAVWAAKGLARLRTPYFRENAGWVELLSLP